MGRPREFDREHALDQAMNLFWVRGYEGASLQDLLEELGICNSSFYQAFQSKERLFDEVLDRYYHRIGGARAARLAAPGPAIDALRGYFSQLIEFTLDPKFPGGCLVTNTAVLIPAKDPAIARKISEVVHALRDRLEGAFAGVLERGRSSGELRRDLDARVTARMLVGVVFGLNVMARVFRDRRMMEDAVRGALASVVSRTERNEAPNDKG